MNLFKASIQSCGKEKEFEVSELSMNLFEARSELLMVWLWKEAEQWKGESNHFCDETITVIGLAIERQLGRSSG